MTPQEKKIWYDFLQGLGVTVNRQKVIGEYIVDFCIQSKKIVIEIDGSQHYDEENAIKDKKRDEYLSGLGYTVLRYSNRDINCNFPAVCSDILNRF